MAVTSVVVVESIHVLINRVLGMKPPIAAVTFILRAPVVECIHVLVDSVLASKLAIASLALIIIIHVEFACQS